MKGERLLDVLLDSISSLDTPAKILGVMLVLIFIVWLCHRIRQHFGWSKQGTTSTKTGRF